MVRARLHLLIFVGAVCLQESCVRWGFGSNLPGTDGDLGSADLRQGSERTPTAPGSWIKVPAGSFSIGSPTSEPCREEGIAKGETQHVVRLSRPFEISSSEVTQAQFASVLGYNPAKFSSCGSDCPVENVSWHEAAAYCNALSGNNGFQLCYACTGSAQQVTCDAAPAHQSAIAGCSGYRLPTEAEWEYAYRAGTSTAYYSGSNNANACDGCLIVDAQATLIGWYAANSRVTYAGCESPLGIGCPSCAGTHPVRSKQPNSWGLYDMAGNVWEWCHDWYRQELGVIEQVDPSGPTTGTYRSGRGGSWDVGAKTLRAANRGYWSPTGRTGFGGFRCVRSVAP